MQHVPLPDSSACALIFVSFMQFCNAAGHHAASNGRDTRLLSLYLQIRERSINHRHILKKQTASEHTYIMMTADSRAEVILMVDAFAAHHSTCKIHQN